MIIQKLPEKTAFLAHHLKQRTDVIPAIAPKMVALFALKWLAAPFGLEDASLGHRLQQRMDAMSAPAPAGAFLGALSEAAFLTRHDVFLVHHQMDVMTVSVKLVAVQDIL
ncbi:hypothetical protein R5R35_002218 [Gryllus longicercus]|uniref:Uncharacterized protein n=1 Tax=Gryllus longicercus TaxID=2509291 RepID=A0AAN9VQW7_9ORTH